MCLSVFVCKVFPASCGPSTRWSPRYLGDTPITSADVPKGALFFNDVEILIISVAQSSYLSLLIVIFCSSDSKVLRSCHLSQ